MAARKSRARRVGGQSVKFAADSESQAIYPLFHTTMICMTEVCEL